MPYAQTWAVAEVQVRSFTILPEDPIQQTSYASFAEVAMSDQSRLHPCLKIPELLAVIFESLYRLNSPDGRASLARLARTCRLFHDSALDMLWQTQVTLFPLIKLFPEELRVEENHQSRHIASKVVVWHLAACFA